MGDFGGQRFAAGLGYNRFLVDVNLSQNGLSNCTCFVLSKTLKMHPSMRKLDLGLNPLGEAGSRAIFRAIFRGLKCFVIMRGCSYNEDTKFFNHSYPSMDSPYTLDLSEPYNGAVFSELTTKIIEDPINCAFESIIYRESNKLPDVPISFEVINNQASFKMNGDKWAVPTSGQLIANFAQSVFVPTINNVVDEKSFDILQIIVENGRTETDRKQWLKLLCQDIYCSTTQAQSMIDRFKKNKTIGPGGLSSLDIIISLWKYLVDTNNMFDFLYKNTDSSERRDLIYALTIKRYKFNWTNPTGSWKLNLADKEQRSIMLQLIAINNYESEFSRTKSRRGDTSQMGYFFNSCI
jgi:hypothetical protein